MSERINVFNDFVNLVADLAPDREAVYLVGGAIRDLMLNRPIYDWDFVVKTDARPLARKIANRFNGAYYLLDEERKTARVIAVIDHLTERFTQYIFI